MSSFIWSWASKEFQSKITHQKKKKKKSVSRPLCCSALPAGWPLGRCRLPTAGCCPSSSGTEAKTRVWCGSSPGLGWGQEAPAWTSAGPWPDSVPGKQQVLAGVVVALIITSPPPFLLRYMCAESLLHTMARLETSAPPALLATQLDPLPTPASSWGWGWPLGSAWSSCSFLGSP